MNLKITLKRSKIGCTRSQKATLSCLGLRKINHSSSFKDSPALRGQINKVKHLIRVESLDASRSSSSQKSSVQKRGKKQGGKK